MLFVNSWMFCTIQQLFENISERKKRLQHLLQSKVTTLVNFERFSELPGQATTKKKKTGIVQ